MHLDRRKAASMIGLSMKAGKVASGEFAAERAVKQGKAYLVVTAEDASGNTQKKFQNMCAYYQVPCRQFLSKEELGTAIGKEYRACLAVLDVNLAHAILQQLEDHSSERNCSNQRIQTN